MVAEFKTTVWIFLIGNLSSVIKKLVTSCEQAGSYIPPSTHISIFHLYQHVEVGRAISVIYQSFHISGTIDSSSSCHNHLNGWQNVNRFNDLHQSRGRSMQHKWLWAGLVFSRSFSLNNTLTSNEKSPVELSDINSNTKVWWLYKNKRRPSENLQEVLKTWKGRNPAKRGTSVNTFGPERSPAPSRQPSPCR